MSDFLKLIARKALSAGDPSLLQVGFDTAVLERYRADPAYRVIRTNTAGRVSKLRGWSIDFGIADGDSAIHASWGALSMQLPESERDHWAMHSAVIVALSDNFLRMQLSPMSCFDDGDVRPW
jgi:hypothetical protein